MTETPALSTPAADALAAQEDDLRARIEAVREESRARYATERKEALFDEAISRAIREAKKSSTKDDLVKWLANDDAQASKPAEILRDLRQAETREARIIADVEAAPKKIAAARAKVIESATNDRGWGPENTLDAAVEWNAALSEVRLWLAVPEVAANQEISPEEALVIVARSAAADLISTVGSGSGRSTSATRNLIRESDVVGVYAFLRVAARSSKEVANLIRY